MFERLCRTGGTRLRYDVDMGCKETFYKASDAFSFLFQPPLVGVAFEPVSAPATKQKRNTKHIGDISEARVIVALTEAGYLVSKPFGENARYDLIADDGERLHRVQVKTGRVRGGVIVFNCYSSHAHRRGRMQPYFGQIEYLAVYCPQIKKVYLLPEQELTASVAHLRLSPTRNNMAKMIRWASKFELA